MKKILFFWFFLLKCSFCWSQENTYKSIFLTEKRSKNYLLQNGFKPFVSRFKSTPPNPDWLEKKVNDTLVSYIFQEDRLIHIDLTILLRNHGAGDVLELLNSSGFAKELSDEKKIIFYNKNLKIRYQVFIHAKDILLVNAVAKRQDIVPKMDSVSRGR